MTEDFLEYPRLMERALRGVVRDALRITAERGLPGLHHFYITFRTRAPGVGISDALLAQYPEEITIVLEHEFWDLAVEDEAFAVTLSFGGVRTPLRVPFDAVTGFVDPSVKFGLQFQTGEAPPAEAPADTIAEDGGDETAAADADADADADDTVVALDRFRKK